MAEVTVWRDAWDLAAVHNKVAALNERIAAKGLGEPITIDVGPAVRPRDEITGLLLAPRHQVTITFTELALPGDWTLAAVADWTATDTPLVWNLDEVERTAADFDRARCDHCNTRRQRNQVMVVIDADGATMHVGTTCIADFLGHNATKVLAVRTFLANFDDEDWGGGGGGGPVTVGITYYVAAAAEAVRRWGWHKAAAEWPTKAATNEILFGRDVDPEVDEARAAAFTDERLAEAAAAVEWAAGLDPRSDFERNMQAVAATENIGERAFGTAAYIPVAHNRHLNRAAEKAAAATADAARPKVAVPEGRHEVVGEVVGLKWHDTDFGTTLKMTVADDRGFKVWVTAPAAIGEPHRGDRIRFTATLTRADDDATFGFGKRPAKAEVLAEAA